MVTGYHSTETAISSTGWNREDVAENKRLLLRLQKRVKVSQMREGENDILGQGGDGRKGECEVAQHNLKLCYVSQSSEREVGKDTGYTRVISSKVLTVQKLLERSFSSSSSQTWQLIKISCENCYVSRLPSLISRVTKSESPWANHFNKFLGNSDINFIS